MNAGEDRSFTLEARTTSNGVQSLSAATVSVRIGRPPRSPDATWPVMTKTASVVSAGAGTFSFAVSAADTQSLMGDYRYESWATISAQLSMVCEGRFRVNRSIENG